MGYKVHDIRDSLSWVPPEADPKARICFVCGAREPCWGAGTVRQGIGGSGRKAGLQVVTSVGS